MVTGLLVWVGLALSVLWVARCLQVGCTRMLPVAALLAGLMALWTPPGQALRAWLADSAILLTRLAAWAVGPLLTIWLSAWVMRVLVRHPTRAGAPARWAALSTILVLGVVCALLLEPLPEAAEHAAGRASEATVNAGWRFASLVPDP